MSQGTTEPGCVGEPPPRGTVRLLLDPTVGSYVGARLLASMGIWVHSVVAAILVYEITGSVLLVGAVSIAQFAPETFLAPWMGALADRRNRRLLAVTGRVVTGSGSIGLGVWTGLTGIDQLTATPVILAALVIGIGFSVSAPAMQAIMPSLARPSELSTVVALAQTPMTFARATGPALGALLLLTGGPAVAFLVAGVSHWLFALVVLRLRLQPVERRPEADFSVLGGFRFVREDTAALLLLVAVAAVGFGLDPAITLTPALADGYGGGTELVALMASAFGAGAATAVFMTGLLRRWLGEARLGSAGIVVLAGSMVALAISPTPAFAVASLFAGGMGMIAGISSLTAQLQHRIPEDLRGRVMALWGVSWVGSRPLAAALNGSLADLWSPAVALLVSAILLLGAALITSPGRLQGR